MASWLMHSSPDQAVWVRTLAGGIVLCSWARHFTLTVPLSTQVYKWVLANLMLGVTLQWTSIPSRGEQKCSQLLHAKETGISSGMVGHLAPGVQPGFFKGWVTLCQNEGTHQIVMSFSLPVVGCLLKKWLTKGGSRAPQDPPSYAPAWLVCRLYLFTFFITKNGVKFKLDMHFHCVIYFANY